MSSGLFLPPRITRELADESRRRETEALKALSADHWYQWKKEFDAQLEHVVHGMRLVSCPDPAPLDAVAQGASPGRWHLVWPSWNGGPLNIAPLVLDRETGKPRIGGDGDFAEPGSWVFDQLAESDLWSDRVQRERRRIRREAEEAKRKRQEQERADRDQDVLERVKAVTRTQISMNRSVPWTQNHAGSKRTKGEARKVALPEGVHAGFERANSRVVLPGE
jgi:hypothetical protein